MVCVFEANAVSSVKPTKHVFSFLPKDLFGERKYLQKRCLEKHHLHFQEAAFGRSMACSGELFEGARKGDGDPSTHRQPEVGRRSTTNRARADEEEADRQAVMCRHREGGWRGGQRAEACQCRGGGPPDGAAPIAAFKREALPSSIHFDMAKVRELI